MMAAAAGLEEPERPPSAAPPQADASAPPPPVTRLPGECWEDTSRGGVAPTPAELAADPLTRELLAGCLAPVSEMRADLSVHEYPAMNTSLLGTDARACGRCPVCLAPVGTKGCAGTPSEDFRTRPISASSQRRCWSIHKLSPERNTELGDPKAACNIVPGYHCADVSAATYAKNLRGINKRMRTTYKRSQQAQARWPDPPDIEATYNWLRDKRPQIMKGAFMAEWQKVIEAVRARPSGPDTEGGRAQLAILRDLLERLREIDEYDPLLGKCLVMLLCGGSLSTPIGDIIVGATPGAVIVFEMDVDPVDWGRARLLEYGIEPWRQNLCRNK